MFTISLLKEAKFKLCMHLGNLNSQVLKLVSIRFIIFIEIQKKKILPSICFIYILTYFTQVFCLFCLYNVTPKARVQLRSSAYEFHRDGKNNATHVTHKAVDRLHVIDNVSQLFPLPPSLFHLTYKVDAPIKAI